MNSSRKIKEDLYYIGASDRRLAMFENVMPVPEGVSYNSYVLIDDKTVLLDTVDNAVSGAFLENLQSVLNDRALDYVVIHHVEPDHLALLEEVVLRHPQVTIICSAQAAKFISQFFDLTASIQIVKEGDTLETGHHTLTFVTAPMVHWPEVLLSYESTYKILFSADAFGTFKALSGNLYADELSFDREWLGEARRYYTNIVGKYGPQVQAALKKAAALGLALICPLLGPISRTYLDYFIQKYDLWSRYEPEDRSVMIVYGSPYGHTESAATVLAGMLANKGGRDIHMYDVSTLHVSYLVAEAFRYSHIVLAAPTYNGGLFPPMENFLLDLKAHNMQNRVIGLLENGTWAPVAAKAIRTIFAEMKSNTLIEQTITLKSALKKEQLVEIEQLASTLALSLQ